MGLLPEEKIEEAADAFEAQIKAGLGERCDSFDPGCLTCQAWRSLDDLNEILFQVWKAERT